MLIILILFFGLLLGLAFVQYLTVHPLKIQLYPTIILTLTSLTAFLLLLQAVTDFYSFLFSLTGLGITFFIGYFIRARQVMAQEDTRKYPTIERSKEVPGKDHTKN